MTLTVQTCTEIVRQRMNLADDSQAARIIAQIPSSLKAFARKYAADPFTRPLVSTDKTATSCDILTGGKVDLAAAYDRYQFLLEYIDLGQIYLLPVVTVAGSPATGTLSFDKRVSEGNSIVINGVTFIFSNITDGTGYIPFSNNLTLTATNTAAALNASTNILLTVASYSSNANIVTITYDTNGTTGNAFTLVGIAGHVIVSGATLSGGASAVNTDLDAITISTLASAFSNYDRVQFTTTGSLPGGLSLATNYYLVNYSNGTGQLSSTSNGLTLVNLSNAGSGVLAMTKMDATGNPIQKLRNPQQMGLPQYLSNVFNYYTVQADSLYIQAIDGIYPTGTVACSLPFFPLTVGALPDSEEAERVFLDVLTEQCLPLMKQKANA